MKMIGARVAIVDMRKAHPEYSLTDLARACGVTRERVRQILVSECLPTRRLTPRKVFADALAAMPAPGEPEQAQDTASNAITAVREQASALDTSEQA